MIKRKKKIAVVKVRSFKQSADIIIFLLPLSLPVWGKHPFGTEKHIMARGNMRNARDG